MRKLLPFLSLLTLGACTLPGSLDECTIDSDCPSFEGETQRCTSDHLCAVGTPAEKLCTEVYPPNSPANAIVVGMLVDSVASDDLLPVEAVKLGIDEVNQRRFSEPPLALHICDTNASVEDARKSMQVLARQRNAVAVVGPPTSSAVFAIKDEVIRSGIPIISYSATSPEISSLGSSSGAIDGLFYRVAPSDDRQAPVLASLLQKAPAGNYAILYVDDPYGRGLKDSLIGNLRQSPDLPQLVLTVKYLEPAAGPDFDGMKNAVDQITHYSPTLSYVVAITNLYAKDIVTDLQAFPKPNGPLHNIFMTDGARSQSVLDLAEPISSNSSSMPSEINQHLGRITGTAPPADTANTGGTGAYSKYENAFNLQLKDKYKDNPKDPASNPYAAYAYDAFYAAAIAIGAAGTEVTPDRVAKRLGRINRGDAAAHKCYLDPDRANQLEVGITGYIAAKDKLGAASGLVLVGASGLICFTPHGDRVSGTYEPWTIGVNPKRFG